MVGENNYIDIDLSPLREIMGKMIPGGNYELYIIKRYKKLAYRDNNTVALVDKDITEKLKNTDALSYVGNKYYYSAMFRFIANMETLILHYSPADVKDIAYEKVIDINNLIVRFKLLY